MTYFFDNLFRNTVKIYQVYYSSCNTTCLLDPFITIDGEAYRSFRTTHTSLRTTHTTLGTTHTSLRTTHTSFKRKSKKLKWLPKLMLCIRGTEAATGGVL